MSLIVGLPAERAHEEAAVSSNSKEEEIEKKKAVILYDFYANIYAVFVV